MSANKNLTIFNKINGVKLTESEYKVGYKKASTETRKVIHNVVSDLDKQVNDTTIFNGKKLYDDYKNKVKTTKEVVDELVEFILDADTKGRMEEYKLEEMFKGVPNGIVILATLSSMIRETVEGCIINDMEDDEEVLFELIFSKMFNVINSNKAFYGCSFAELFVGEIKENSYKFILDFNDQELLRYLKVNMYI